jgi:hypothetical protein
MNFIVDDIGAVVKLMRKEVSDVPYYMYGHRLEIAQRLKEKEGDKVFKNQKYPLVALRLDVVEEIFNDMAHYNLNIILVDFTDKNYNAEDRYLNVFKPKLYPMYQLFIEKIIDSGLFTWEQQQSGGIPPHTKIDRPYWGTESAERNNAYIFHDPLDAIEIVNLKLISRIKNNCNGL